jgi:predicted AAA+ superfamily ATPase
MLARSMEVSTSAITNYLDILEGALLIRRMMPYQPNVKKRLVKSSKIYIRDTGILHRLAGLDDEASLEYWAHRGSSFEGLVVEELITAAGIGLRSPEFYFYRTQAGAEVDLLVMQGGRIWPIEIKLGINISHYDLAGLRRCMEDLGTDRGFVVYRGETRPLTAGIHALSWDEVAAGKRYPWLES